MVAGLNRICGSADCTEFVKSGFDRVSDVNLALRPHGHVMGFPELSELFSRLPMDERKSLVQLLRCVRGDV